MGGQKLLGAAHALAIRATLQIVPVGERPLVHLFLDGRLFLIGWGGLVCLVRAFAARGEIGNVQCLVARGAIAITERRRMELSLRRPIRDVASGLSCIALVQGLDIAEFGKAKEGSRSSTYADSAEVVARPRLHEGSRLSVERLTQRALNMVDDGRRGFATCGGALELLLFAGVAFAVRSARAAARALPLQSSKGRMRQGAYRNGGWLHRDLNLSAHTIRSVPFTLGD